MPRYNHCLVERNWREIWAQTSISPEEQVSAFTVQIPTEQKELGLENSRLLVFADFFSSWTGKKATIFWFGANAEQMQVAKQLGLQVTVQPLITSSYNLGIVPRDYVSLARDVLCDELLFCGRFFAEIPISELLPDFGADALRIYFLYQGPPERDYQFQYTVLTSAYRFVQKIWRLSQEPCFVSSSNREDEDLNLLHYTMIRRLQQKKPHTALAAVMEFLKDKTALTQLEVITVAKLLKPYTPFLTSEILRNYGVGLGSK